jgi:transposase
VLLVAATVRAQDSGLIDDRPEAAIDATGLESQHTSHYYFARSGKKRSARLWTKLTVVCHTGSHFFTSATVSTGPSNDGPQFAPAMKTASLFVCWNRLLADAAYDSEENHRLCREELGIRSTVIPINRRSQGRRWPRTKYRRQMKRRFHNRKYGQRWQSESAFSRHKRLLGPALRGRSEDSRERESFLRVLTHDIMLLAAVNTN